MTLILHLLAAFTWGVIIQWPWGAWVFHAIGALAIIHLLSPFWFHVGTKPPLHRAFLFGPLALAFLDALFLFVAWRDYLWGDITFIVVAVIGSAAALALIYSLLVMTILDRWRTNREKLVWGS